MAAAWELPDEPDIAGGVFNSNPHWQMAVYC
jgi:hypothetical protein